MTRTDRFLLVVLIGTTIIYTWFFAQFHIDPHHDGIILKPAIDVLQEKRLFVDSFTQYGALTTLIHAFFMKFFGATLYVQRLSAVFFYCISAVLLYMLSRKFFPPVVSLAVCFVWLLTAYFPNRMIIVPFLAWSSVYALTFQLAALLCYLAAIQRSKWIWSFLAGVFCALAFWVRQPVGVFLFAGFFFSTGLRIFLLRNKNDVLKDMLALCGGTVIASIPFFVWLLSLHAVHDWWLQSIVLAFHFGDNLSGGFSIAPILLKLFPSVIESKKNLLWLAAIISSWWLFASQFYVVFKKSKQNQIQSWSFLACAVIALASWMQFFPANDQSHFFWAGTPMLLALFIVLWTALHQMMEDITKRYRWEPLYSQETLTIVSTIAIVCLLSVPFFVTDIKGTLWYLRAPMATITRPSILAGMKVEAAEKDVLDTVEGKLDTYFSVYPKKTYINASPDALYNLVDSHTASFYKAHVYWDWTIAPVFTEYFARYTAYVTANRPVIIWRDPVPLSQYCVDDVSTKDSMRVQMYNRPLFMSFPAEDIVSIEQTISTVKVSPKVGDVRLITATYSAALETKNIDISKDQRSFLVPKDAKTVYISFTNTLAGECTSTIEVKQKQVTK